MLILLSSEERIKKESELVNEIMSFDSNLIFHLRKPSWDYLECRQFLFELKPEFLTRTVIHQHHFLAEDIEVKGTHLNSSRRKEKKASDRVISSSFHSLDSVKKEAENYDYFFCSPLFKSISKPGYEASEKWDIHSLEIGLKSKAVALGGMHAENIEKAYRLGFSNFASLGSVWKSDNPIAAYKKLYESWQKLDPIA